METHLQNRSFHVVELEERERLRNILKMKNAGSKHAELLFFIVKYVNLRRSCLRRDRDCLSSLMCLYALFKVGVRVTKLFCKTKLTFLSLFWLYEFLSFKRRQTTKQKISLLRQWLCCFTGRFTVVDRVQFPQLKTETKWNTILSRFN